MARLRACVNPHYQDKVWMTDLTELEAGTATGQRHINLWVTPAEARALAQELLAAADELEPCPWDGRYLHARSKGDGFP